MESHFQNAEGVCVPNLGGRQRVSERTMVPSACPSDEFPNPSTGIGLTIGILRREALVIVIVSVDDYRRTVFV